MVRISRLLSLVGALAGAGLGAAACSSDKTTEVNGGDNAGVLVINANTAPVDILIDGSVVKSAVPAGQLSTFTPASGTHQLVLRQTGTTNSVSASVTTSARYQRAFAAVRGTNGALAASALDDTGALVPAGATKLRVVHLAANAGEIQVYRTQPDYQQQVRWQFPFTYQTSLNSLSAPYYQSTVGSWEVHAWISPADQSGWASAPVKVTVPLGSGEKKTIVILDKDGGGIRYELID